MGEAGTATKERGGRLPLFIGGIALLSIVIGVIAIKMINDTPTAAEAAAAEKKPGAGGPPSMPPASVFVVEAKLEPAQNLARVTGGLRPVSRSEIAAQEAGAIKEILVDEGQIVEINAPLVRLDGRRIEAELTEARAALKTAGSVVTQRDAELKRATEDQKMMQGLFEDRSVPEKDLLDAVRALAVSKAQLDAANGAIAEADSRIKLLEIREKDLEIRAPFLGLITERHVEPGEWVAAGEVVMTLISGDPIEAWMRVPERFLQDVRSQPERVRVLIESVGELTPKELRIVPDVDPRSRMFVAVAVLDNSSGRLAAGQSLAGEVPVGELEPHLIIPVDALLRTERGDFVFRASEKQSPEAERIPVKVAFEREGEIFLLPRENKQIKEGDQIVVEGNDRLQPNQALLVKERAAEPAAEDQSQTPPKE
ncbi:MAG: RND family efflux transporter MFP subunit [Verrucomicrobiales bacterium]|jgi:RND family efflux transporter MFP subunit